MILEALFISEIKQSLNAKENSTLIQNETNYNQYLNIDQVISGVRTKLLLSIAIKVEWVFDSDSYNNPTCRQLWSNFFHQWDYKEKQYDVWINVQLKCLCFILIFKTKY